MTNPISDYERNKAMGLLTDENDPYSIRKPIAQPIKWVKCKYCDRDTTMATDQICPLCGSLKIYISRNPLASERILKEIQKK